MTDLELIDSIIVDLNKAIMASHSGQFIQFCALIGDIGARLAALKTGIEDEKRAHKSQIDLLNAQLRDLTTPPPLKDGEIREGGECYNIDMTTGEVK